MAADDAGALEDQNWDGYSYVVSSQYRTTVVEALADGPSTPSGIADATEERITHISRALGELKVEGVTQLLVPEDRKKGRVYSLTDEGTELAEMLEEHN